MDAANIEEAVNKSLARLGTDYVDLLQVHWPDRYVSLFGASGYDVAQVREGDIPFDEQLRGLERVITAGKVRCGRWTLHCGVPIERPPTCLPRAHAQVRYIGVSNETSWGVSQFCRAAEQANLPRIVSIQNSYSLIVRGPFETDLAEVRGARRVARRREAAQSTHLPPRPPPHRSARRTTAMWACSRTPPSLAAASRAST